MFGIENILIHILQQYFVDNGIGVVNSENDADVSIITTAIGKCDDSEKKIVIVGEDVDLAVLMVALTPPQKNVYYY